MLSHLQPISQVEVNKQTASQNAAAVGCMVFQDPNEVATRINWITQVQVITIPNLQHWQNLIKMPSKMAQLLVQTPFSRP